MNRLADLNVDLKAFIDASYPFEELFKKLLHSRLKQINANTNKKSRLLAEFVKARQRIVGTCNSKRQSELKRLDDLSEKLNELLKASHPLENLYRKLWDSYLEVETPTEDERRVITDFIFARLILTRK